MTSNVFKMADEKRAKEGKSISFSFSKKKESKTLKEIDKTILDSQEVEEHNEEKDFIVSAEGKQLRSAVPKEKEKEKIIPLQKKNRWIRPPGAGDVDSLDKQAVEELIRDATKSKELGEKEEDVAIPLLMRNAVPQVEGFENDEKLDIAMRPNGSTLEDYESMPVGSFGAAMLRGMGWKKGEAIGGINKGLIEPVEYIHRSKGLGLGAERMIDDMPTKKRKPGDPTSSNKSQGPIKEKDGRVRHVKGVGETAQERTALGYYPGVHCVVLKGPHKHIPGKIIAVDEDNMRVIVKLHLGGENLTLHQSHIDLLDEDKYRRLCKDDKEEKRKSSREYDERQRKSKHHKYESSSRKETKYSQNSSSSMDTGVKHKEQIKCWMYPQIRVRIVSKSFKKGKYYNRKVKIVDVIGRDSCVCETDEGRVLEGVPQSALETVIPKTEEACIRVVQGKFKGLLGTVLKRNPTKCEAVVQLLHDKSVLALDYDSISENLGTIDEDIIF